jgi:hypothetical protein
MDYDEHTSSENDKESKKYMARIQKKSHNRYNKYIKTKALLSKIKLNGKR